jgi:hypothetical protein
MRPFYNRNPIYFKKKAPENQGKLEKSKHPVRKIQKIERVYPGSWKAQIEKKSKWHLT